MPDRVMASQSRSIRRSGTRTVRARSPPSSNRSPSRRCSAGERSASATRRARFRIPTTRTSNDSETERPTPSWRGIGSCCAAVTCSHPARIRAGSRSATRTGRSSWQANGTEVRPEPQAGAVFARVVRHESTIAIGCLDLASSESASWMKQAAFRSPWTVTVRVLAPLPRTPALRPPSSVITATDSSPFLFKGSSTGKGPRSNSNSPSMPAGRSPGCTRSERRAHYPGAAQSSGRSSPRSSGRRSTGVTCRSPRTRHRT